MMNQFRKYTAVVDNDDDIDNDNDETLTVETTSTSLSLLELSKGDDEEVGKIATTSTSTDNSIWTLQNCIQEIQIQCKTAIPTLIGIVLYKIPWLISLHFVGQIGQIELAAAALASTLCNVTGLSLSVGLSSALATLTSQSRGYNNKKMKKQTPNQKQQLNKSKDSSNSLSSTASTSSTSTSEDDDRKTFLNDDDDDEDDVLEDAERDNDIENKKLLVHTDSPNSLVEKIATGTTNDVVSNNVSTISISVQSVSASEQIQLQNTPYEYLIRGLFIQLLFVIPIGIWWIYGINNVLVYLGQEILTATMTTHYLRILTPGLWAYSINWTITCWLQSLELAYIPAYAAFIGLLFHIPINYLYVYVFNMGYIGCAYATITFQISQPLLIVGYLLYTKRGKQCLDTVSNKNGSKLSCSSTSKVSLLSKIRYYCYIGLGNCTSTIQYLSLAVPGIIAISEWWASELTIFLSGRLHPNPSIALGAMTLYQSINTFCYMFPVCFAVSCTTRVGTLLGSGLYQQAQFAGTISVLCAGTISTIIGILLYTVPHTLIPSLFVNPNTEYNLIHETTKLIPLLSLYVIGDGLTTAINGIIKGCGKQKSTIPAVIIAYWIIAIPLAYYLTFIINNGTSICDSTTGSICGIVALVTAMTIGTWIDMILRLLIVLCTINWEQESIRAMERIRLR